MVRVIIVIVIVMVVRMGYFRYYCGLFLIYSYESYLYSYDFKFLITNPVTISEFYQQNPSHHPSYFLYDHYYYYYLL